MNNNKKKTISIIALVMTMALIFAMPGFAEKFEELKEKFVTREEWEAWVHGVGDATGISQAISNLEINGQIKVQNKTMYEMSVRGMRLPGSD